MTNFLSVDAAVLWAVLWQSTIALTLGAALYFVWRRRPARAHFALVLGLATSVVLPVAWLCAGYAGWGLIPRAATESVTPAMTESASAVAPQTDAVRVEAPAAAVPIDVVPWIAGAWLVGSAFLGLKLVFGLVAGVRMLARARPLANERIYAHLESAMAPLGVQRTPIAFATDAVHCPAIWCWAIHPALLLPSALVNDPAQWTDAQWRAVFSHELAHVRRRDHLAAVLAEVVCAVLWWHPLAWWCRARLNDLSDVACDRWVVASGHAPDDYAETLVGMTPQLRSLRALSIVSAKHVLKRRITAILDATPMPPDVGKHWRIAVGAAAVGLVCLVACMQQQAPADPSAAGETAAADSASTAEAPAVLTLANPGIESGSANPDDWSRGASIDGVEYIWDKAIARTGSASLCLRKTAQRYFPIAQWTQTIPAPTGKGAHRVRLGGWVKAEQAYKAILDLQYTDAQGDWKHEWAAYIGAKNDGDPPATHDWTWYSGEVDLPEGATTLTVGLQIYGPGTVWFDDIELTNL